MDEKLDKLIRLLIDNGISLNRIGDWFCCTELELDFSEHDKVFEDKIADLQQRIRELIKEKDEYKRKCNAFGFENQDLKKITKGYEDKIAELKKDYKTVSELLGKYQQENESLKKRIQELDTIDAMRIDEKRELKQRIDELEKELEEWKAEAREIKKNRDEQLKSFRKAVEPYVDIGHMHETIEDLKQHIAELEQSRSKWIDRAVEWQQKCEKLESKETLDLPFDPLECANYLINSTYERETNGIERTFHNLPEKVNSDRYTVDDLEQIAEHLLVYCKHNKERDNEKEI